MYKRHIIKWGNIQYNQIINFSWWAWSLVWPGSALPRQIRASPGAGKHASCEPQEKTFFAGCRKTRDRRPHHNIQSIVAAIYQQKKFLEFLYWHNPHVTGLLVRLSVARYGCHHFYGKWHVFLAAKGAAQEATVCGVRKSVSSSRYANSPLTF